MEITSDLRLELPRKDFPFVWKDCFSSPMSAFAWNTFASRSSRGLRGSPHILRTGLWE